jgi:hypothetical protein
MASNLARAAIDHFGINNNKEREEKSFSTEDGEASSLEKGDKWKFETK